MKTNTPPSSEADLEEDFDIGEIEEVIEINDEAELEAFIDNEGRMQDEEIDGEDDSSADIPDMAAVTFTSHFKSVFCCCLSPSSDIAATGGEDDLAYVWDTNTGNVIFTCTGHKDSIIAVKFSYDGKLLATADMSGYIQVWKIETQSKVWECDDTGDLNWIKWHHACNVLVGGTADGSVWKWLVPQSPEYTHTFGLSGVSTQCGTMSRNGKHIIVGYEDGSIRVFDLKSGNCVYSVTDQNAHTEAVTCVVCHPTNNSIVLSSSMDGTSKIYNVEKEKIIGTLNCQLNPNEDPSNSDEVSHSVEVISVQPSNPNIAVTATLAGIITIWDLSTQISRHHIAQGCGTSQMAWHPTEPILFTSGLDGVLRSYDVRSGEPLAKFTGHSKSLLSLTVSNDGSSVLTTSDDGTARLFRIQTES